MIVRLMFGLTLRQWNAVGALACAAMMAFALYAQYVLHLVPCNMCVLQRIAVCSLGMVFLLAAVVPCKVWVARVSAGVIGLTASAGVAVALRHVWMQAQPLGSLPSCGADFYSLVDIFGFYEAVTRVLAGGGDCQAINWTLLGFSMPLWVSLALAALGVSGVLINLSLARTR